ncbi:hypothetical protein [Paratractidigestivibacter sp.]|uniref:hypothetical protein n=1 Tax=Paratractidigestivibacter sp. TaxID=2847316 RepID=UPI002ABDB2C6|nr:hypothetical protein [Paratractidigestivibacter sp.]
MDRTVAAVAIAGALCITPLIGGCVKSGTATTQGAESSSEASAPAIEVGQTVTVGDSELTITGLEWCNEFKQGNAHVSAGNVGGETLLRVTATVKNYSTHKLCIDFGIKAPLVINDKYEVGANVTPVDDVSSLDTVAISFYYPMSNELAESFENGQVTFEFHAATTDKISDVSSIDNLSDGTQVYYAKETLGTCVLDVTK